MAKRYIIILITASVLLISVKTWQSYNHVSNEGLALQMLGFIKNIRGKQVVQFEWNELGKSSPGHDLWNELSNSFVDSSGRVDYRGFLQERDKLDAYLSLLSENPPNSKWSPSVAKTYWINAYNAFTIQLVLSNWPVVSIKDVAGAVPMINSPWDLKFFKIGGIPFDLNSIEHKILRKQYDDHRIHFAINCASRSCPALRHEAYAAERLEEQLEDQTYNFINNPLHNEITSDEVNLSPIFKWYSEDFGSEKSLLDFLSGYSGISINHGASIQYKNYDWSVND